MTFNASAAAGDVVQIEDSPNLGRSRIRSANGTFELLDYANKTNVAINGLGGGDTFNLTAVLTAPGLASLAVIGGASGDTFNVTTTTVARTLAATGAWTSSTQRDPQQQHPYRRRRRRGRGLQR